ncbi:MAG: xylulokinase [Fimbriimonadaceae bacterium]|nr:xylulokinase [Fimbriimonadaceae bacterium]
MSRFLGIDLGTSGVKALVVDENGRLLKQATAEYPLLVPRPLWSEQRPEDWWNGVLQVLGELDEPNPEAIGVTGQMHGSVFLDANDESIRPALLWNDQRTAAECAEIDARFGPENVRRVTCNPPLTGFQAPKILWLRNHEPDAFARLRTVLLPKDFVRLKLTGEKATDVSDASGTGVFQVAGRRWATELLAALDLPTSLFPKSFESWEVTGKTKGVPGLADGIPVVAGGGDQAAAAVGTGAVKPGVVSVSLGTSGVVFVALEEPRFHPQGAAHTFCHANGAWHAMGVMLSCGGALRWYRDTLGGGQTYDELTQKAETAPPGCDGLTFLPYLTGERCPHNDPLARGGFLGLTLAHTEGHLARAVFEGISFGLVDGMALLRELGARVKEIRVTSGGAKSGFWVQLLADAFEAPCHTLELDEGPALGAAILAGVGVGLWPNVPSACEAVVRRRATTEPSGTSYADAYRRYRAAYPATKGLA